MKWLVRAWNYRTNNLWVWVPMWLLTILLLTVFLG
jgi:hypothetical protein